nr:hypothetical protein [Tanacetum cinerariifolium]
MTTLAEHILVAGAENRPPMLEKSMYDSWASGIRLFIKGKKHGRMMLDSIDNGSLVYPTQGEDPIECINKAMEFLSDVASRGIATTSMGNVIVGPSRVVKCYNCQGKGHMERQYCDDLSSAKAILIANLSSCDPEVLSQVSYSDSYLNDMINQDVQEIQYSEQTHVDDFEDNKIHSGTNIILYSQYLQESQDVVIQDTNPSKLNDLLVLSLVKQMTDHVAHLDKENQTNKMRIQPTLYDGSVIAKEHVVISVIDDEETLILKEKSRSKMLDKQNDPISIEKKIEISPIDYSKLNKIKEDFRNCFVTKKELFAEQAFWLKHSSLSKTHVTPHTPIRIKAPNELPKSSWDD